MADKQALIDGLNEDLNLELEAILRYMYHAASATGLLGHELRRWPRKIWPANWRMRRFWPTRSRRSEESRHQSAAARRSRNRPRRC